MKCHYEILGVPLDVEHDELKKSYRKLALKWHPDKNPNNQSQAKDQFQLIQQAYDILSDPQERSWYDRHRDAILRGGLGGDYKDTSLDVFPYFTTTCFKGYTDEPEGFYAVYREVFNKIAAEDLEFSDDPEIQVPGFGTLGCDYETVVHTFYAHWAAYSTKKTYSWLEPYDARDTPNRRVLRLVEKENKKIRDKARRERNEAVRSLVAFVRKRDRRVHAWARELERRAAANVLRTQQRREQAVRERRAQVHAEPSWAQFASVENELRAIEAKLAQDDPGDDEDEEEEAFYCAACNKVFKTCKAFGNHEQSKKHREGVAALRASLIEEDAELGEEEEDDDEEEEEEEESGDEQDSDGIVEEVHEIKEVKDDETHKMQEDNESSSAELDAKEETLSESDELPEQFQPKTKRSVTEPAAPVDSDSSELETNRKQRRQADRKDSEDEVPAPRKLKGKKAKDARKRARAEAEAVTLTKPSQGSGQVANGAVGSKSKSGKVKVTSGAEELGKEEVMEDMAVVKGAKKEQQEKANEVDNYDNEVDGKGKESVNGTSGNENVADAVEVNVRPNGTVSDKSRMNEDVADKFLKVNGDVKDKSTVNEDVKDKGKARANNVEEAAARRGGRSKKDLAHTCVACHRGFPSKNKLFEHLKATGHAVALSESAPVTEKRPGRKNRAN